MHVSLAMGRGLVPKIFETSNNKCHLYNENVKCDPGVFPL